ncbi:MAG: lantibiotic immunity ABC transporter MutE/EpiE family permease subunit [Alicyclobacillaceae bacterium]|nr:lantibiotic immunity ABC transporter MutE/EpiE family permease subunit [Alicyclobacillaceae bacterium]
MLAAIHSEWLKYRRTPTYWIVIGGPLVMALAEWVFSLVAPGGHTWHLMLLTGYNWWVVLAIPLGSALLAALSSAYERRSGAWRILCAYPVGPSMLYAAKFAVLALQTAIANGLFAGFLLVTQIWHLAGPVPWGPLILGAAVGWLSGLTLLAIQLWFSTAFGFGVSVVLGLVGLISGVFTSEHPAWLFDPWAWPLRALAPVFGFHANGLPLEADSPLWNPSVIPVAGGLGIGFAIVFTALGARWLKRRDIR